jgi:hypothetical protein
MKKSNCIDCGKEITWGCKRCPSCFGKNLSILLKGRKLSSKHRENIIKAAKERIGIKRPNQSKKMSGNNNPMYGVHLIGKFNGNFKGGVCSKQYFCKICGVLISANTALYGKGQCKKCYLMLKIKNKVKNFCIDCGCEISYSAKRCKKCGVVHLKVIGFYDRENNPNYSKIKVICPICKHSFLVKESRVKSTKIIFCSKKCFVEWRKQFKKGKNNPNWKGGITSLSGKIRALDEYKIWRKRVFERDDYTCQECGIRGGDLEVHHKKTFHMIFKEFLQLYSQFSPIEDKETLVRLATTYAPFWDVDNGQTLCKFHHKSLIGEIREIF